MKINWEAISAIGQCLGSLGTFLAIVVALNQNRPKIKIRSIQDGLYRCKGDIYHPVEHIGENIVTITNIGMKPIKIVNVAYRLPNISITTTKEENEKLPKHLEVGESISIKFKLHKNDKKKVERLHLFYVIESSGDVYYENANSYIKIKRFMYLKFARFIPKHREVIIKLPK
ncbi:hypothetical protein [Clostridium intestinale]|uniref:Uncharacterized protein n=1 Tax=Clostridium intestinale TaxID=36845 RepID=A0A7D6ZWK4_9CLOT|nr:hypothetical protein [Clostridium intestinale]QLY79194.1 hypothetical protein HZF06_19270 [Clostridium intestinale]